MKRIIDISENLAVLAQNVAAVKKIDEDSCVVFLVGQSAVDGGFLVARPWDEVIDELNSELEDEFDDGSDDGEEADQEED